MDLQEALFRLELSREQARVRFVTNRDEYALGHQLTDLTVVVPQPDASDALVSAEDFIERVAPEGHPQVDRATVAESAIAAAMAAQRQRRASAKVLGSLPSGWRNSVMPPESVTYAFADEEVTVRYRIQRSGDFWVGVDETEHVVTVCAFDGETIELEIDGRRIAVSVATDGDRWLTQGPGGDVELVEQPRFPIRGREGVAGGLVAPMPSNVLATHVAAGDKVEEGQLLMVLEAMKMEHRITAPMAGTVAELRVAEGDQVANGELLIVLSNGEGG